MIKDLAFVLYPVTDMGRSRKFYEETLGMKVGETFGETWIEFQAGSSAFAITNGLGFPAPASSAAFEVDDLEGQIASLKAAGVSIEGDINDFASCRMALVKDPDGNTLCLHQKRK